jgi:hypothetical protein
MIIKATVKFYTRLSSRIKVVFDSNGKFGKIENEILLPTCQSAIELKIGVKICEHERWIGTTAGSGRARIFSEPGQNFNRKFSHVT